MAGIIKRKIIRPVRNAIVYWFFRSIFFFTKILPRKPILAWHGALALFVFNFFRNSRKVILQQLNLVFGEEFTPKEIYKMGQDVFVNLGKTFTDFARFSNFTTREQFSKYFTFEGEEHLKKAYEKGKGVLCLTIHTSGWEFSAIMPPVLGYKTAGVSQNIKNSALNDYMIQLREKRGMKNITKKNSYEKLINVLSAGECLIIMIDQDSKNNRGDFLKFFGRDAYTPLGCARLAMETGAVVVPMATFRNSDNTYVFQILPEIPFKSTGNIDYDLHHNTQIYNDVIESLIREHITQWVWLHKRWDTTPKKLKEYLEKRTKNKK